MSERTLVDLGKTNCLVRGDGRGGARRAAASGAPGLATGGGVDAALDRIRRATDGFGRPGTVSRRGTVIGVGAAGAIAAPDAAGELARRLVAEQGYAEAIVTSDVIIAHLGALSGRPGVVVIAGTGAVALAVNAAGVISIVDGAGPGAGDVGGGGWIGAEALRLALAGSGSMATVAGEMLGADWRRIATGDDAEPAHVLGGLVPRIGALARSGDQTAYGLLVRSARAIASSALQAAQATRDQDVVDICVVGGVQRLGAPWTTVLTDRLDAADGVRLCDPAGDALDGAAMLVERTDLPHERQVHRHAG
ncbi:ATPase [Leekyejoonella antrihumi]|uniref:ATPase n=1 Tax=Leekyejoonella antrihumi TaxID=1660198 RepID=A0A563E1G8_9MICO|nr:ATPase [Leekyejoonella antrihumi]TWP36356.1 ATPase [Leekyejoonella antrihumi]